MSEIKNKEEDVVIARNFLHKVETSVQYLLPSVLIEARTSNKFTKVHLILCGTENIRISKINDLLIQFVVGKFIYAIGSPVSVIVAVNDLEIQWMLSKPSSKRSAKVSAH